MHIMTLIDTKYEMFRANNVGPWASDNQEVMGQNIDKDQARAGK